MVLWLLSVSCLPPDHPPPTGFMPDVLLSATLHFYPSLGPAVRVNPSMAGLVSWLWYRERGRDRRMEGGRERGSEAVAQNIDK